MQQIKTIVDSFTTAEKDDLSAGAVGSAVGSKIEEEILLLENELENADRITVVVTIIRD